MVGHSIWSCKNRTRLTILTLTVTEEQGICCRIVMSKMACLADKAFREGNSVLNAGSGGNNEVFTDYTYTDMDRSVFITVDASALQAPSILPQSPIFTFLIYPEFTMTTFEPIVPIDEDTLDT